MLKSSGAMGAATLASRLLGLVREVVYARFMGDTWVGSAFFYAFTIPNLFRRLLGEGVLTAAFIPVFKDREQNAGASAMWRTANAVMCGLALACMAVVGVALLAITLGLRLASLADETRLMLELLRVMFPYLLFVCATAVMMGILNARGHFFVPAMGASVLNVVMIGSVLWLAPRWGGELPRQIFALAAGVLVAGLLQALFQLPVLWREGFRIAWVNPIRDEAVREVARKMLPGIVGVAAFQINVVLTQGLAFWVGPQIVASFNYAVRLMELPQGVFGISLATYLLPTLSGLAARKRYTEFGATLRQGLGYIVFINALASVLLLVLATPIMRLLFERGQFGPDATGRAAFALACLAPSLVAYSAVNILARAFYALGDTRTPMQISLVCLGLNLVFTIPLVLTFKQGGLGLANTISSIFNVWLLAYGLRRKLRRLDFEPLVARLVPLAAATVLAGQVAWILLQLWERGIGHDFFLARLGAVFVPMGAAALVYGLATILLGIPESRETAQWLRRRLSGKR